MLWRAEKATPYIEQTWVKWTNRKYHQANSWGILLELFTKCIETFDFVFHIIYLELACESDCQGSYSNLDQLLVLSVVILKTSKPLAVIETVSGIERWILYNSE